MEFELGFNVIKRDLHLFWCTVAIPLLPAVIEIPHPTYFLQMTIELFHKNNWRRLYSNAINESPPPPPPKNIAYVQVTNHPLTCVSCCSFNGNIVMISVLSISRNTDINNWSVLPIHRCRHRTAGSRDHTIENLIAIYGSSSNDPENRDKTKWTRKRKHVHFDDHLI